VFFHDAEVDSGWKKTWQELHQQFFFIIIIIIIILTNKGLFLKL
jgi:hypothetical protein